MAKNAKLKAPKMYIRKGDMVEVISGNDKGARGRVLRVIPRKQRVIVEGVNIRKKHQRPVQAGNAQVQAGIIQFEAPIHVSKVMLIDPASDERTRVGFRRENGEVVRYAKKSGEVIE